MTCWIYIAWKGPCWLIETSTKGKEWNPQWRTTTLMKKTEHPSTPQATFFCSKLLTVCPTCQLAQVSTSELLGPQKGQFWFMEWPDGNNSEHAIHFTTTSIIEYYYQPSVLNAHPPNHNFIYYITFMAKRNVTNTNCSLSRSLSLPLSLSLSHLSLSSAVILDNALRISEMIQIKFLLLLQAQCRDRFWTCNQTLLFHTDSMWDRCVVA